MYVVCYKLFKCFLINFFQFNTHEWNENEIIYNCNQNCWGSMVSICWSNAKGLLYYPTKERKENIRKLYSICWFALVCHTCFLLLFKTYNTKYLISFIFSYLICKKNKKKLQKKKYQITLLKGVHAFKLHECTSCI